MPSSTRLDIRVPRQGSYFQEWQLRDIDEVPIDLTGHTLAADARLIAGDGSVIASADIVMTEAITGRFNIVWNGADFDTVGEHTEVVRVAYDLKHTFPDSLVEVPVAGQLLLMPEVTE